MPINKVIAVGIILIIIFYIFSSYTLFIFSNKDEYRDLKEAIGIVGLIIGFMVFLMLFLGK